METQNVENKEMAQPAFFAERSESVEKLFEALAKAQAQFKEPPRNGKVDYLDNKGRKIKYFYATLSDLVDTVKRPLVENGLSFSHLYAFDGSHRFGLKTVLAHTSGQFISSFMPMPEAFKTDLKGLASQTTYLKRYSLSALTGVPADTDDDGGPPVQPKKPAPTPMPTGGQDRTGKVINQPVEPKPAPVVKANMGQIKRLNDTFTAKGYKASQVATISVALFQCASARDLTSDQIEDLIAFVEKYTVDDASAELAIKLV